MMPLQDFWFQEYSVQVTFREQWNDERLRYVDSTKGKKVICIQDKVDMFSSQYALIML